MPHATERIIDSKIDFDQTHFDHLLACPVCHSTLSKTSSGYTCNSEYCKQQYPRVRRIPILISESISTFNLAAYAKQTPQKTEQLLRRRLRSFVPRISTNLAAKGNLDEFKRLLLLETAYPVVLVLGGAEVGVGMRELLEDKRLQCLESDVVIGPRTAMVLDASFIPFQSESIDGIVIQAVLEYIPDPAQAVAEIFRVLKPGGLVYSEMPFMQHVHGGRYDFTRLTHLGHLRLYRRFVEVRSGACAGPATGLAWALQYFFLSFVKSPSSRDLVKVGTGLLFFWLKYFDYLLAGTPGGLDATTGTYLLARKGDHTASDRQIIAQYRGAVPATEVL